MTLTLFVMQHLRFVGIRRVLRSAHFISRERTLGISRAGGGGRRHEGHGVRERRRRRQAFLDGHQGLGHKGAWGQAEARGGGGRAQLVPGRRAGGYDLVDVPHVRH